MAKAKKKPSLLTSDNIYNLKYIDTIFEVNEKESVSQACLRFGAGRVPDEDLLIPAQKALSSFCKDNPKLNAEEFEKWYNELIENEEVFRLDKVMLETMKEARQIFDKKMDKWINDGLLNPDYDTNFAFRAIIGMVVLHYSYILSEKMERLNNDAFFKEDGLFSKYKILALEYEDDSTLNSFQNAKGYNGFDVEAILLYVTERLLYATEKYEWCECRGKIQNVYNEVKKVVYEDADRKLGETKGILEKMAKSSEKKFQYAFLYTAAVIEWHMKNR